MFHVGSPGANPEGIAGEVLAGGEISGCPLGRVHHGAVLHPRAHAAHRRGRGRARARARRRDRRWATHAAHRARRPGRRARAHFAGRDRPPGSGCDRRRHRRRTRLEPDPVACSRRASARCPSARAAIALALAVVLLLARSRDGDRRAVLDVALVLCVGLVLAPAASGHANVSGALSFVADVVHVQAASIWVGGLALLVLALVLARGRRWELATDAVPRFSQLALVAVAALLVAGIVNGYLQVRTWSGALGDGVRALAPGQGGASPAPARARGLQPPALRAPHHGAPYVVGRSRLVPAHDGPRAGADGRGDRCHGTSSSPSLRRARSSPRRGPSARLLGPATSTWSSSSIRHGLEGTRSTSTCSSRPEGRRTSIRSACRRPSARRASARSAPRRGRVTVGHWAAYGFEFPVPGDWQLLVEARRGEFESLSARFPVPIEGPGMRRFGVVCAVTPGGARDIRN